MKSSIDMELKGCQDCFAFLKAAGLTIALFISDRHRSIAKWIREQQPATEHFFDIWHVAKSVSKKLLQVGKESGCELLVKWQKAITICTGVLPPPSLLRHVCNKHDNHPDHVFRQCVHGPTSRRHWLEKDELFRQIQLILNIFFLDLNPKLTCNLNTPWEITLLLS